MALNLGLAWEKVFPFTSFAEAEKVADAALSAKTQAAETRVKEATEATKIAAEVLRASREEVRGLKAVVQSLKKAAGTSGSEEAARLLEEEKAKVREAQMHVQGLTKSFDTLLSEMEKLRAKSEDMARDANGNPVEPEKYRPEADARGDGSYAVAVARVVLLGYSTAQAEESLRAIGRNDSAAAVAWLKEHGALPETAPATAAPTPARLGHPARVIAPQQEMPIYFPKGRPPAAAAAAIWPSMARSRKFPGDIFVARRRAVEMLVALTAPQRAGAGLETPASETRELALNALTAQKVIAHSRVSRRLIMQAGGMEAASAALAIHRRDPLMVCAACAVLRELTAFHDSMAAVRRNPKATATAMAAVAAMKCNPGHAAAQTHAIGLLWGLCSLLGEPVQSILLSADVGRMVLAAMETFRGDRELTWRAVGCLLALARGNAEAQAYLVANGGREAVRRALLADPTMQYGGEFSTLRPWMRAAAPPTPAMSEVSDLGMLAPKRAPMPVPERPPSPAGGCCSPGGGRRAAAKPKKGGERGAGEKREHTPWVTAPADPQWQPKGDAPKPWLQDAPTAAPARGDASYGQYDEYGQYDDAGRDYGRYEDPRGAHGARARERELEDEAAAAAAAAEAAEERRRRRAEAAAAPPHALTYEQLEGPGGGARLPVYPTPTSALEQAIATLLYEGSSAEGVSAALRVVTKECGLGNAAAVAADACLVLGMLTQESDAAELALLAPAVADGTAVTAVLHALQVHPAVMALQATGAWAFWGLVRGSKENIMRAISMGAPETLVAAMRAHAGSPEVAQSAAGALLALAMAGKWAQDAVAKADGPMAVKAAMRAHASISFKGEFDALRDWLRTATAGR